MAPKVVVDHFPAFAPQHPKEVPAGLPRRALAVARAAEAITGDTPTPDATWHDRAALATRTLATTLGIDPGTVIARPDLTRACALRGALEVQLAVIQTLADEDAPSSEDLMFIPESGRTDTFLWLLPCDDCHQSVPTYRVASLIDLGRHIDAELSAGRVPDTHQFASDPGHYRNCGIRRHQVGAPRRSTSRNAHPVRHRRR